MKTAAITRMEIRILAPWLVNFSLRASPRPIPETMPKRAAMDCMMMTDITDRSIAHRSV